MPPTITTNANSARKGQIGIPRADPGGWPPMAPAVRCRELLVGTTMSRIQGGRHRKSPGSRLSTGDVRRGRAEAPMPRRTRTDRPSVPASPGHPSGSRPPGPARRLRPATRQACRGKACGRRAQATGARSPLEATARPVPPGHWAQDPVELDARLHADLGHKQLRSLLCAQLSAVQAAADPDVSSPGSLSDTLAPPLDRHP